MNERFELIKPYIKGKTVLDIGCCGLYSRLRDLEIPPITNLKSGCTIK